MVKSLSNGKAFLHCSNSKSLSNGKAFLWSEMFLCELAIWVLRYVSSHTQAGQ